LVGAHQPQEGFGKSDEQKRREQAKASGQKARATITPAPTPADAYSSKAIDATLLDSPTAATALGLRKPTMIWSMTLKPIWNTDSTLTGIASRKIFFGSPRGFTSVSAGFVSPSRAGCENVSFARRKE